jgi:hemolysin activation/secretion protein
VGQPIQSAQRLTDPQRPPSERPLPEPSLPILPPPEQLLPAPTTPVQPEAPGTTPDTLYVERFEVVGSTVFSPEELAAVTAPFTERDLSFAELLQARAAVTQLYVDRGYVTSGALIPPQTLEGGVVVIQVVEGRLEDIAVSGTERLRPGYISSRLRLAAQPPLNLNRLLEGLQLLQLNPLIATISADLQAGTSPDTSLLQVQVTEADSFTVSPSIDNGRSPSVGSFRRRIGLQEANLSGLGDGISLGYTNTDGSNGFDASYSLPLNPRNGTLSLAYGITWSRVIEPPFDELDLTANSRYYELTYRQPVILRPSQELALGFTLSRQESQTELGIDDIGPFPLSPGADANGETRVSALRFFQDWTQRSRRDVLALRSQFSLGVDWLNASVSDQAPDSRFLAWRGQAQWVRLLAPDMLLLLRGDLQLTDSPLLSLEQFGLGGPETVRGYRQDALLTDNGALLSAEVRLPVLRVPQVEGLLQIVPFADFGSGWNVTATDPNPSTIAGLGLGLLWRMGDRFSARLDYGIPLVRVEGEKRNWQENGLYFSVSGDF